MVWQLSSEWEHGNFHLREQKVEWVAWEAWAAEKDQQMPEVGAETHCVRSPWLPIEPLGTGAQGMELEVRVDHEVLRT